MSNAQEVYKHDSDLQKLIRPQWSWRAYFALFVFIIVLFGTAVHLKLNFYEAIIISSQIPGLFVQ